MTEYDVVVVGAGILGLSTAYHIKLTNHKLKVLIVERNPAAGLGSTLNSAAAFRCFFSSRSNMTLANSSVEFYKHLQHKSGFDLKMRWCGYLWAFTHKTYQQVTPALKEMAHRGFKYREYSPEKLAQALGMQVHFVGDLEAQRMKLGSIHRAVFIPKAGLIDVMQLVRFFESEFVRLGGEIRYRTQVSKLLVEPRAPLGCLVNHNSGKTPP